MVENLSRQKLVDEFEPTARALDSGGFSFLLLCIVSHSKDEGIMNISPWRASPGCFARPSAGAPVIDPAFLWSTLAEEARSVVQYPKSSWTMWLKVATTGLEKSVSIRNVTLCSLVVREMMMTLLASGSRHQ